MQTSRYIARILYYLSRIAAWFFTAVFTYCFIILVLWVVGLRQSLPVQVTNKSTFIIFYPFTRTAFLLGDNTTDFIVSNFSLLAFYTIFIWFLGDVFQTFRQSKLFTSKGVSQLSRFYITNLVLPVVFLVLVGLFGQQLSDMIRISFLHVVIGIFAYFMASLFKQGLVLQEEQDQTL